MKFKIKNRYLIYALITFITLPMSLFYLIAYIPVKYLSDKHLEKIELSESKVIVNEENQLVKSYKQYRSGFYKRLPIFCGLLWVYLIPVLFIFIDFCIYAYKRGAYISTKCPECSCLGSYGYIEDELIDEKIIEGLVSTWTTRELDSFTETKSYKLYRPDRDSLSGPKYQDGKFESVSYRMVTHREIYDKRIQSFRKIHKCSSCGYVHTEDYQKSSKINVRRIC